MKHLKKINENVENPLDKILKDLESSLNSSRQGTISYDYNELKWRDGYESGLEFAIDLIKENLNKN